MAKENKTVNTNTITGISIIRNNGKVMYSPVFSNKGYILTPENGKKYTNYIKGYIACMVIFLIAYIATDKFLISLGITAVAVTVNVINFYLNFISKASTVTFKEKTKQAKDPFVVSQARDLTFPRIKELIICCILLVVIFVLFYFWQKPEGIYFYVILIAGITSFFYLLINAAIWNYKKKHFNN